MNREELIKKWLDNELNDQELKAFQAFDDYDDLMRLSEGVKTLATPDFDIDTALNNTLKHINTEKVVAEKRTNYFGYALRIAAVIVVALGLTYFALNRSTEYSTELAEKINIELPDASEVELNAFSTLSFKERNWDDNRDIALDGEAYFKVAKGKTFNVITDEGTVTVLGTQFNVKNRDGIFQVVCYEGSVKVVHDVKESILKPGDQFMVLDGKFVATEKENITKPAWLDNKSRFNSIPYSVVIDELQRQYAVKVKTENVDLQTLFTGTFDHNDLSLALKSITLPLNLKYHQGDDGTIVLSSE